MRVRSKTPRTTTVGPLQIESLDHEGKGIARHDGKVMFIEGALPGRIRRGLDLSPQTGL